VILALVAPGEAPGTRVGLTVSRKVGCAVVRNRVKRWLREAVREVGVAPGGSWDIVFVARPQAAEAGYSRVREDVQRVLGGDPGRVRRP
jgi:ribonuclease P protein component